MIDEYWTWTFYGYHSDDLSYGSAKLIVARCDGCCQYRVTMKRNYRDLCRTCSKKGGKRTPHTKEWTKPMEENKECSLFLGVHVAERVLRYRFEGVKVMPFGNPGYDFICGAGYKVDVKSACRCHSEKRSDRWIFHIFNNRIAEYFLCLAFDNREDLNPEHIWLIPAGDINKCISVSISESQIGKWFDYKLDIEKVVECCDTIR